MKLAKPVTGIVLLFVTGVCAAAAATGPQIFWVDPFPTRIGGIWVGAADGSVPAKKIYSTADNLDGIAVDTAESRVYFTAMTLAQPHDAVVRRGDWIDGKLVNVVDIVPHGSGVYTPKQLQLDAAGRKVYFCDREGRRVYRAPMDGVKQPSDLEVLVDFRSLPDTQDEFVGVAVDPARGEFYWSDRVTNTIWRARLDAGETITPDNIDRLATPVVQYRRGMTIDLWLDTQTHTLYWSDRGEDKPARTLPAGFIASVQLDDPNRTIHYLARGLVKDPIGISGDAGSGTLYFSTQNDARIYRLPLSGQAKPEALYQQGVMAAGVTLVDWSQ